MKILESSSWEVKLYIGSKEGYHGKSFDKKDLLDALKNFQKKLPKDKMISLRVSECTYVVGDWQEDGWEVACINYPRFPKQSCDLDDCMKDLAIYLLEKFKQNRITVTNLYKSLTFEAKSAEKTP